MTSVQRQPAAPQLNGNASYGANVNKALVQEERIEKSSVQKLSKEHDIVLKTFRILIADLCSAFNMGHPGYVKDELAVSSIRLLTKCSGAIGMAAIGVALWKYQMKYAPHSPDWFNRDRFVLSNGQ